MSQIPPERWISNLLLVCRAIADKDSQERRWLAPDASPWEHPDELINTVDDFVFEGFLREFSQTLSDEQRIAAFGFWREFNEYCDGAPQQLEPVEVLADPRWNTLRCKAAEFVAAFQGKWTSVNPLNSN